jgi:sorbitol-specific phosphotransferase system component IIBC
MKNTIFTIISAAAKLLLLSLICDLTYEWTDLSKIFGTGISYSQWVGIVVIVNTLLPDGIGKSKSIDDKQGS